MVKRAKREEQVIYNLEMKQSTSKGELSQSLTESANHLTGNHSNFFHIFLSIFVKNYFIGFASTK